MKFNVIPQVFEETLKSALTKRGPIEVRSSRQTQALRQWKSALTKRGPIEVLPGNELTQMDMLKSALTKRGPIEVATAQKAGREVTDEIRADEARPH